MKRFFWLPRCPRVFSSHFPSSSPQKIMRALKTFSLVCLLYGLRHQEFYIFGVFLPWMYSAHLGTRLFLNPVFLISPHGSRRIWTFQNRHYSSCFPFLKRGRHFFFFEEKKSLQLCCTVAGRATCTSCRVGRCSDGLVGQDVDRANINEFNISMDVPYRNDFSGLAK